MLMLLMGVLREREAVAIGKRRSVLVRVMVVVVGKERIWRMREGMVVLVMLVRWLKMRDVGEVGLRELWLLVMLIENRVRVVVSVLRKVGRKVMTSRRFVRETWRGASEVGMRERWEWRE